MSKPYNKILIIIFVLVTVFLLSCCSKIDEANQDDILNNIADEEVNDDILISNEKIEEDKISNNEDYKSDNNTQPEDDNTKEQKDRNMQIAENNIINHVSGLSGVKVLLDNSFKLDNSYYVVVKIPDVILSFGKYTHIWDYYKGEEIQGAYSYELWKYNEGILQRLIYNSLKMRVDNYENHLDGNFIVVEGDSNNYIIKYKLGDIGQKSCLYECRYTDFLVSPDGEKIAAINNEESAAIIQNDKIIADTATNGLWFPTVNELLDYWWSNDSNRFYYTYGFQKRFLICINVEQDSINTGFNSGVISSSLDSDIYDKDNDYVVFSTYVILGGDVSDGAKYKNEKHLVELKLLNLKTNEFFTLDANNQFPYSVKQVSDTVISYNSPYREDEVILDISDYIDEGRKKSIKNVYKYVLNNNSAVRVDQFFVKSTDKFNGAYYHTVDINGKYNIYKDLNGTITLLIENANRAMSLVKDNKYLLYYMKDGSCELREYTNDTYSVISDIELEILKSYPDNPYILTIGVNGDVNIIKGSEVIFSDNIYDGLVNNCEKDEMTVGNIYWSKDYKDLIMLIKEDRLNDELLAIKKINFQEKNITTVVDNIAGDYDHIFIENKELIAVYTENNDEKISLVIHNLLNGKKKIIVDDANVDYYGYIRNDKGLRLEIYENHNYMYEYNNEFIIEDDFIE